MKFLSFILSLFIVVSMANASESITTLRVNDYYDVVDYTHRLGVTGTALDGNNETDKTVGVEYEYRPFFLLGLGATYEYSGQAKNDDGSHKVIGMLYAHPFQGLRLGIGYGEEATKDPWNGVDSELVRYSVGYDIQLAKHLLVTPVWSLDRINDEEFQNYGIGLNFAF
jgi:hypothetical protein